MYYTYIIYNTVNYIVDTPIGLLPVENHIKVKPDPKSKRTKEITNQHSHSIILHCITLHCNAMHRQRLKIYIEIKNSQPMPKEKNERERAEERE